MLAQTSLHISGHELDVRSCEYEESQNLASALVEDRLALEPRLYRSQHEFEVSDCEHKESLGVACGFVNYHGCLAHSKSVDQVELNNPPFIHLDSPFSSLADGLSGLLVDTSRVRGNHGEGLRYR